MPAAESFDAVIRELIDFANMQVGAYMDAMASYAGHTVRVERQVHRAMRPVKMSTDEAGHRVVVSASYEDPSKPDIVLSRTVRASDYLAANAPGGSNEQQHVRAVLIFLFTYWELEIRPRLAKARGAEVGDIKSDIMGDLRTLRNVILHAKAVLGEDDHRTLRKLGPMFKVAVPLHVGYEDFHRRSTDRTILGA